MLKFFRTIRKKLIEEDNVRKYLLYAIGEILLVVIGILIALQVNNWNEERVAVANEKILLQEVLEAVQADSVELEAMVGFMDSTFTVYSHLYQISIGSQSSDSVSHIDLMRTSVLSQPVSKMNYPDLASKVLDNDLKKSVFDYYQVVSIWEHVLEEYNKFIEDEMRPFLGRQELLNYGYHHTGNPNRDGKIDPAKLIIKLNEAGIQQKLFEATQKTRNIVGLYEQIVSEREHLVREIKRVMQ
jgi:hypothetical protein